MRSKPKTILRGTERSGLPAKSRRSPDAPMLVSGPHRLPRESAQLLRKFCESLGGTLTAQ